MPLSQPIAIQSWCYRHFKSLPDFFSQLKAAGVNATEVCGVHANFNDATTWPDTISSFKSAGVEMVAIGVERLTGIESRDRPKFEFCKAAGIKNISITFGPDVVFENKLPHIEKLADEYNLNLGIHNHGGYDWLGNDTILKYIFSKTGHRIGLHIDTAWALDARQNPVKWATDFGPRVHGVHVKDFTFDRARKSTDVIIGTGNLDLPAFIAALNNANFSGPLVIEYEGDETNPVPALKQCVQILEKLR